MQLTKSSYTAKLLMLDYPLSFFVTNIADTLRIQTFYINRIAILQPTWCTHFLYSTIVSYHVPLHVSSVTALILRRTLYICSIWFPHALYAAIQHSLCHVWQHTEREETRYCMHTMSSWGWALWRSKHVEEHDKILLLNKENCASSWL
jgi:hypothetical protein